MKISIQPNMLIGDLQRQFNHIFSYLKLEFYKTGADIKVNRKMSEKQRIGDGQQAIIDSSLEVIPTMTVKELEKSFMDQFTLTAQVFRKSGNVWLQTTITDDWTLEHQNQHGKEISEENTKRSGKDIIDFDLDRQVLD